jgi:hypothetical protein
VHVRLERSGGYTGLTHEVSFDTDELPPDQRVPAEDALRRLTDAPSRSDVPGGVPRYTFTFADEDAALTWTPWRRLDGRR